MVPFANSSFQQLVSVSEGRAVVIDLPPIDCYPSPTIYWRNILTGVRIASGSQRYHLTLDNQLVILSTRVNQDNGSVFRAEAQNIYTFERSNSASFLVSVSGECYCLLPLTRWNPSTTNANFSTDSDISLTAAQGIILRRTCYLSHGNIDKIITVTSILFMACMHVCLCVFSRRWQHRWHSAWDNYSSIINILHWVYRHFRQDGMCC